MMKTFVCRNEKCAQYLNIQHLLDGYVAQCGGEPRCPGCGSKDSFQDASSIRTHLPEPPPPPDAHPTTIEAHERKQAFIVKDSGKRQEFSTGARRDTQDGKGDFSKLPMSWVRELAQELQKLDDPLVRLDLVPVEMLCRLARIYGAGGLKYDEGNYKKGINLSRYIGSKERHGIAWAEGDQSEDHLAQEAWNCFSMMWTEEAIRRGELPPELGDHGPLLNDPGHTTNQRTGLSVEPGGQPIIPLRDGVVCKVLTAQRVPQDGQMPGVNVEREYSYVVVRRAGAVVMGWVRASHLSPLTPST